MIRIIFTCLFIFVLISGGCISNPEGLTAWEESGLTSEQYMKAAHTALIQLQEKGNWLTIGSVIKLIGSPDSINFMPYIFDEELNVRKDLPRFSIHYSKKGVHIFFSTNGLVESVVYDVSGTMREGLSSFDWPQTLEGVKYPIIVQRSECADGANLLIEEARLFGQKNKLELDWYFLICSKCKKKDNPLIKQFQKPCKARIVILDCFDNGLARVNYLIEGQNHKLFCDIWWKKTGDKWEIVSEDLIERTFAGHP